VLVCAETIPAESAVPSLTEVYSDDQVRRSARIIMSRAGARRNPVTERRQDSRQAFPYPFQITPVDGDVPLVEATLSVIGKHMSERGVNFYHSESISYRRVIATFESDHEFLHLMLELTSCRFGGHGWYENGGRFLRPVDLTLS